MTGEKTYQLLMVFDDKNPRLTVAKGERLKNSNCCLIIVKKQHAANVPEENKHITQRPSLRLKPDPSHSIFPPTVAQEWENLRLYVFPQLSKQQSRI